MNTCPYCRSENVALEGALTWWVLCHACHASGPTADTENEAVDAWNRAPQRTAHAKATQEGIAMLTAARVHRITDLTPVQLAIVLAVARLAMTPEEIARETLLQQRTIEIHLENLRLENWLDRDGNPTPRAQRILDDLLA